MMFQTKLLKFDAPLSTQEIEVALHNEPWLTRKQIANKLGCAKSPTLIKAINGAIAEGRVLWTKAPMPNGIDCFWYHLPDDFFEENGCRVTSQGQVIFD